MHIQVLQSNLSAALRKASRFLSSKPQLPILSCFLLEVQEQEIWLTATDLQMGMRLKIEGKILETGSTVIPAKVFTELVSSLTGEVDLELQDLSLSIKTTQIKSSINTFPEQDFPPFPKTEGTPITLPMEYFNKAVELVTFAAGKNEMRPILTSVSFELAEQTKIVSTDGFRLAVLEVPLKTPLQQTLLFPSRAIEEITKVMQSENVTQIELSLSEGAKQVFFSLPNSQVVLRTLEGEFPGYKKIIPDSFSIEVKTDADELLHHIKSAMIFSNDGSNIIYTEISPDQLQVSAKSSVLGAYESSLKAVSNTPEVLKVAFNGKYLIDFLPRLSGKEVVLRCNTPLKPVQFSSTDIPGYFYIVMPFKPTG